MRKKFIRKFKTFQNYSAVEFGNDAKVVELILEKGRSDPNIGDWKGDTPLHLCTAHEMVDPLIVGTLLEHGADPNQPNDEGDKK